MIDAMQGVDEGPEKKIGGFKRRNLVEDYAAETKQAVEEAQSLVENKQVDKAIEKVLAMEKKARLVSDFKSVESCCLVILKIFEQQKDWENLNKYLVLLCKRRSQAESVISTIVSFGAKNLVTKIMKSRIPEANAVAERIIETLREISAGKLQLEVVRAELTMVLAKMKEDAGDVEIACKLVNEETPETYTSMEKRAKTQYILEQIRLCLATKEHIRAKLLLKKVDKAGLEQYEDLKIAFYELQIQFSAVERDPFEIAKSHFALFKSESVQEDSRKWKFELKSTIVNLACAKYSNEVVDMIHRLLEDRKLLEIPEFKSFLSHFVTDEVAQWPLPEHQTVCLNHPSLSVGVEKSKNADLSSFEVDDDTWLYKMLFDRVVQHDIRVISKYYDRIYIESLSEMLNLTSDVVEVFISGMVADGDLLVKIDRPEGVVEFRQKKSPDETLTDWTLKINDLVGLVDKTCHLIHKENMLHEAKANLETDNS